MSTSQPVNADQIMSAKDAWNDPFKRDLSILEQLVSKDFKLKYRRSILGVAWSVLNPLLMMIVMAAVFSSFMPNADKTLGNYPLYLILGNTAWQLMGDSTSQGMVSIIGAASLLKKVKVNRFVFPVQKVLFAMVNYAFSLVAIAIVMLFFRIPLTPFALFVPVALLLLGIFSIGLALLLATLSVFFRDVIHLWSVFMTAWMYATPLFYSYNILPEWMKIIENFNPMYCYVTLIRDALLWQQMPTAALLLRCALFAFAALALGWIVFHKNEHKFILYI
ncbi:ABC transporter permease [Atopobium fossor]|uniref:ABC transporter permease n=1 Tax=Atopobium fossor TaxID=39487 RepID=UPI000483DACF